MLKQKTHISRMDFPIVNNWLSLLLSTGVLGVIFYFILFHVSSAASHIGIYCSTMSHKKGDMLNKTMG